MTRFVIANKRSGKFNQDERRVARERLDLAFDRQLSHNVSVIGDTKPDDSAARRIVVFDANPNDIVAILESPPPDVIIEPEILHYPTPSLPFVEDARPLQSPIHGPYSRLEVHVRGNDCDLEGAVVLLIVRGARWHSAKLQKTTTSTGRVRFAYPSWWTPTALIVVPAGNFWSCVVRGPSGRVTVDVPPLPVNGPLGWWHKALGCDAYQADRGHGVRVGVIDTGCGPHPHLNHVTKVGAFINSSSSE